MPKRWRRTIYKVTIVLPSSPQRCCSFHPRCGADYGSPKRCSLHHDRSSPQRFFLSFHQRWEADYGNTSAAVSFVMQKAAEFSNISHFCAVHTFHESPRLVWSLVTVPARTRPPARCLPILPACGVPRSQRFQSRAAYTSVTRAPLLVVSLTHSFSPLGMERGMLGRPCPGLARRRPRLRPSRSKPATSLNLPGRGLTPAGSFITAESSGS